jgi:hypothetical protein
LCEGESAGEALAALLMDQEGQIGCAFQRGVLLEGAHRPGAAADLAKAPLDRVVGAHGAALGKTGVAEASAQIVEILGRHGSSIRQRLTKDRRLVCWGGHQPWTSLGWRDPALMSGSQTAAHRPPAQKPNGDHPSWSRILQATSTATYVVHKSLKGGGECLTRVPLRPPTTASSDSLSSSDLPAKVP